MKSLKLGNWKFALFALGACVVATPVILSSCGSASSVSGEFVKFTNDSDYNNNKCSHTSYDIDGLNVSTSYTAASNNCALIYKFNKDLKDDISINGKDLDSLSVAELVALFSGSDTFTINSVNYQFIIGDSYITSTEETKIAAAIASATAVSQYLGDSLLRITNFFKNGMLLQPGDNSDYYINIIKSTFNGKVTPSDYQNNKLPNAKLSIIKGGKFNYSYKTAA